jgi:hypothetical protein
MVKNGISDRWELIRMNGDNSLLFGVVLIADNMLMKVVIDYFVPREQLIIDLIPPVPCFDPISLFTIQLL